MAKAELGATAPSRTDLLGKPRQAWVWAEDHPGGGQCGHPQALPLRVQQAQARLSPQMCMALADGDVSYIPILCPSPDLEGVGGADEKVGSLGD